MRYYLSKTMTFDAAHWLPQVSAGHKCARMHGHTFSVTVEISGGALTNGWVRDYADISGPLADLVGRLDHYVLNDLIGNPTTEALAHWFWQHLGNTDIGPLLESVTVAETPTTSCTIRRQ